MGSMRSDENWLARPPCNMTGRMFEMGTSELSLKLKLGLGWSWKNRTNERTIMNEMELDMGISHRIAWYCIASHRIGLHCNAYVASDYLWALSFIYICSPDLACVRFDPLAVCCPVCQINLQGAETRHVPFKPKVAAVSVETLIHND